MPQIKFNAKTLADAYFYYIEKMNYKDISQITGMNVNSISPIMKRIENYLKESGDTLPSKGYQEAISIIKKEKLIREKANKLSEIKNNLFRDLEEIIDGLVENMVEEKYRSIVEENEKLHVTIKFLETQLKNQKIIAKKYQKDFAKVV
jgi:hypothetical protein